MDLPSDSSSREKSKLLIDLEDKSKELVSSEEKVALGLSLMRAAISQEGTPQFRGFWEVRQALLPLFKTNMNAIVRSKLWTECVELTVEARRLKEILEEQSIFVVEQIELAIDSLEKEVSQKEVLLTQALSLVWPASSAVIQGNDLFYQKTQKELNFLNGFAHRLIALRQEVAKTEMRIRFKTKFFKRLSHLGDQIFPKRKPLIEQVSESFEKDVQRFVDAHFQKEKVVGGPYFAIREEIKALQAVAKALTLSSGVFNRTRVKLSECWDLIKTVEKEYKKETEIKREAFIAQEKEAKALEELEKAKILAKKEKFSNAKQKLAELSQEALSMEPDLIEQKIQECKKELEGFILSKTEQQMLDRSFRQIESLLAEKRENALLSQEDRDAVQRLHEALEQKKKRRQQIKEQLEQHRRALNSSNLDFEKAMLYREMIDQEKELLDKTNSGIEEIEQKIAEL